MFEVTFGTNGFERLREKYLKAKEKVTTGLISAVENTNKAAVSEVKGRITGAAYGPNALTDRSGALKGSVYGVTTNIGDVIKSTMGTKSPYGAIQEKGGTIHGRPYLSIPVGAARDQAGSAIYKSIRDVPVKLFRITSKKGNLLLVAKGNGDEIVPYYVMKDQVTLKPRLGLVVTMKKYFTGQNSYFDKEFRKVTGRLLSDGR